MQYKDYKFKKTIIVDIDETIARLNGRGYYDWAMVKYDSVNTVVKKIVNKFAVDHTILFITGRSEVCRDDTVQWLKDNGVSFNAVYMKPKGVGTDSAIFKAQVVKDFMRRNPDAQILFALDDRQKIKDAFDDIGIPTLLV